MFILRGFTPEELQDFFIIITIKASCLEDAPEREPEEGVSKALFRVKQQKDKVVHAMKRKNLSLGEILLSGKKGIFSTFCHLLM